MRWGIVGRVLSLVAVATVMGVGVPASAASPSPYYVALGDSRAATATNAALLTDGCGATDQAYPALVAAQLKVSFVSRACGGATTANILHSPQITIYGFKEPQITAVTSATQLVTVSIGGNDIAWWSLVSPCFTAIFGRDAHCRDHRSVAMAISSALTRLAPRIAATLSAIKAKAPHARVLLVGHGGYFGPHGCPGQANISDADATVVLRFFDQVNAVLRAEAARAHDQFVDVAGPARGHDTCAPRAQRWFEGNAPQSDSEARHATALGRRAMAGLVVGAVAHSGS